MVFLMKKIIFSFTFLVIMSSIFIAPNFAQEPVLKEKQKAWRKNTANAKHIALHQFAGEWKVNFEMNPGEKATFGKGKCQSEIIWNNKFIFMTSTLDISQVKYVSHEYLGYDNIKEKYTYTGLNSMETKVVQLEGEYNPATRTLVFEGKSGNIFFEKEIPYKIVFTLERANKFNYEIFIDKGAGYEKTFYAHFIKQN